MVVLTDFIAEETFNILPQESWDTLAATLADEFVSLETETAVAKLLVELHWSNIESLRKEMDIGFERLSQRLETQQSSSSVGFELEKYQIIMRCMAIAAKSMSQEVALLPTRYSLLQGVLPQDLSTSNWPSVLVFACRIIMSQAAKLDAEHKFLKKKYKFRAAYHRHLTEQLMDLRTKTMRGPPQEPEYVLNRMLGETQMLAMQNAEEETGLSPDLYMT